MRRIIATDHDGPATLRGNDLVATTEVIEGPPGGNTPHTCGCCFYRENQEESAPSRQGDCAIMTEEGQHPKDKFQIDPREIMPHKIDGVEVGHYCTHWLSFDND